MSKAKTFEESLEELEKIVSELESGETSLNHAVSLFEKGMKISAKCHEQLDKAEQKIKVLTEGENGTVLETDFVSKEDE